MMSQKVYVQLKPSDYNASEKTYKISLANQPFNRVRSITIDSISVTSPTDSEYLLVSSKKLQNLSQNKSNTTNNDLGSILYILHPEFRVVRNTNSTSSSTTGVSDTLISAIGTDLVLWWDFHSSRVLDVNFQPVSVVGNPAYYFYNRSPAPNSLLLITQYGNGLSLSNVGQGKGATRTGGWESILDSVGNNPQLGEEFAYHALITMPNSLSTTSYLLDNHGFKIYTSNAGAISFRNVQDVGTLTNLSWIPLRTYILSVQRRIGTQDHNNDGQIDAHEYSWRLEDMSNNQVQTDLTQSGWAMPVTGAVNWRIGRANYHFDHVQGCAGAYVGTSSTYWDNSILWLKAQYSGDQEVTTETQSTSSQFQLVSRKEHKIPIAGYNVLQDIDFSFYDQNGIVEPSSGLLELTISQ
jgi:hypothetical protein